jgi:hypothetical protein
VGGAGGARDEEGTAGVEARLDRVELARTVVLASFVVLAFALLGFAHRLTIDDRAAEVGAVLLELGVASAAWIAFVAFRERVGALRRERASALAGAAEPTGPPGLRGEPPEPTSAWRTASPASVTLHGSARRHELAPLLFGLASTVPLIVAILLLAF